MWVFFGGSCETSSVDFCNRRNFCLRDGTSPKVLEERLLKQKLQQLGWTGFEQEINKNWWHRCVGE